MRGTRIGEAPHPGPMRLHNRVGPYGQCGARASALAEVAPAPSLTASVPPSSDTAAETVEVATQFADTVRDVHLESSHVPAAFDISNNGMLEDLSDASSE